MDWAVRLVIYLIAFIVIILGRCVSKSILHPIRMYTLFWVFLIVVPISWWDIEYKWNGTGLIWILASLVATEIGAIFVQAGLGSMKKDISNRTKIYTTDRNWIFLYIVLGFSFLSVVMMLFVNGFHLTDIQSFESLLSVSSEMTRRRYITGEQTSTIQKIVSIFGPVSVLAGGYAYNYASDRKNKVICCLTFVPVIMSVLLTTAKSGMISSIILFMAGWAVSKIKISGTLPIVSFKNLVKLIVVFLVILTFLYFAMLLRVGDFSEHIRKIILDKFFVYGFGEIVQFDGWFAGGDDFYLYQMATNTYMTVPRLLGLVERMQGVYYTYVDGYGNVFTAFRGIIADFGVFGGIIYLALRGAVFQLCCLVLSRNNRKSYIAMTLIACQYFFGLYGFIISPWIYTTYVLCMIMFMIFLMVFDRRIVFGKKKKWHVHS